MRTGRTFFALSLLLLGTAAALSSQACGDSAGAEAVFPPQSDAGFDVNFDGEPGFEGGVAGLLGAGCATARAKGTRIPVYMLFVLDGSGSMVADNKWTAVVGALDAVFDDLKGQANPSMGFGLTIFADKNDPTIQETTAGPYDKIDVPIAYVDPTHHAALRERIDTTSPNLGTPTFEVLSGQYPLLEGYQPAAPLLPDGKKVLVFMSDGVPDTQMPAGDNEQPFSLALAAEEFAKQPPTGPILTFAVGVGSLDPAPEGGTLAYDPKFMGALAMAGGSPNSPCDPNEATNEANMCHFQITPGGKTAQQLKQEFINAIVKIQTKVISCEFKLEKTGDIDPALVNVIYTDGGGNQSLVTQNGTDGWTYDDPNNPTKVILHGPTCEKVKADYRGSVDIVLGCKTIIK